METQGHEEFEILKRRQEDGKMVTNDIKAE